MSVNHQSANVSLLKKVLRPYILLLLALALAISFVSSILLREGLTDITHDHLLHIQQQAYTDFKNIERLLTLHSHKKAKSNLTADQLERNLAPYDPHITVTLTKYDNPQLSDQQRELLTKSETYSSAYISIVKSPLDGHALAAAQFLGSGRYLLTQHPLGHSHLDYLTAHYESIFYLLSEHGEFIASSQTDGDFIPKLNDKDLVTVLAGKPFSNTIENNGTQLLTYAPLPLGHDGIYVLVTAQPLNRIENLITSHGFYLLGIIGLSLLICITLFRSLLVRLFRPLNALLMANEKVRNGEQTYRIRIKDNNHSPLVKLCIACNELLDVNSKNTKKIERLSKQLKSIENIKVHNQHLRKSNLELENRTINLKEQNQKFSALFKATQIMVSSLDQQLLYERIIQTLKDSLNCSVCVLYIFQPDLDKLVATRIHGIYGADLKSITTELGEGSAGKAALEQTCNYLQDLSVIPDRTSYGNKTIMEGSLLSVPLTVQNRLIGVLNIHLNSINAFSNTSQQIAQAIANQAAIAIENARLYEKTKALSATDDLTGLSNRRQFQEYLLRELAQSRRQHNAFSILMIDIDNFKLYNDFHGHLKGDIVLKKVASLLTQHTRGVDLVARFGGEEFVLLLPKSDKQNSLAVADKLRMCIEKEYFSGAENSQPGQRLTISVGVSHFPGDSCDIYDLMNLADMALYEAKKRGRNTCVGWEPSLLPERQ